MHIPFGFLIIDKPSGLTSHDCVKRLRKVFGIKRIGHGGTLDPSVTGVLPIAIGNATRLLPYLPEGKTYRGTIQLGIQTTTDDIEGDVICKKELPNLNEASLTEKLNKFVGCIEQIPPKVSSININGERAYKRLRRGENFELNSRKVNIHQMELLGWNAKKGQLDIEVSCSSGTYIRSIARDLGEELGCCGTLAKLIRTKALGFDLENAISLPKESELDIKGEIQIINPLSALKNMFHIELKSNEEMIYWQTGRRIRISSSRFILDKKAEAVEHNRLNNFLLITGLAGEICGIAERIDQEEIKPKVVLNAIS